MLEKFPHARTNFEDVMSRDEVIRLCKNAHIDESLLTNEKITEIHQGLNKYIVEKGLDIYNEKDFDEIGAFLNAIIDAKEKVQVAPATYVINKDGTADKI